MGQYEQQGRVCGSVEEHLFGTYDALGVNHNTLKTKEAYKQYQWQNNRSNNKKIAESK